MAVERARPVSVFKDTGLFLIDPALPPRTGRRVPPIIMGDLAWDIEPVATLQDKYAITIKCDAWVPVLGHWFFGPLFGLAVHFSEYTPFWYFRGDDD